MISLVEKLKSLPKKPGVYLFRDKKGKIIYIGKALSLKNRVSSYFRKTGLNPKIKELTENIADLEIIPVNSEFEALLLEAKLIKLHQPKFNSNLKDDKSYLYILIGKEKPERIFLGRKAEVKKEVSAWFGPFATASDAREILRIVRRVFPFRSCKKLPKKPCLYFHLRLCPGVCIFQNSEYSKTIQKLKRIFSGQVNLLLSKIEKELKKAIKEERFEEAAELKKKIDSLKILTSSWRVPKEEKDISLAIKEIRKILVKYQGIDPVTIKKIEGYDVSNLGKSVIVGSMVSFVDGEADKSLYRKFNLKINLEKQDDPQGIKNIISRRLNHPEWIYPQLILVDGGKTQISAAFSALKEKNLEMEVGLIGLAKEKEILVIPKISNHKIVSYSQINLSKDSAALQLLQAVRDEAHRFAQKYYKNLHKRISGF